MNSPMTRPTTRLLLAGAATLVLSITASACGSVTPDAAVVNGVHTSARDFEKLLTDLTDAGATTFVTANNTIAASAARPLLETVIVTEVIHGEFTKRGLTPDTNGADTLAPQLLSVDDAVFGKLPQATRDEWTRKTAEFLALRSSFQGAAPTEDEIAAFYEENKAQIGDATIEQVRDQIVEAIQGNDANAGLRGIVEQASITINPRYGRWDSASGVASLITPLTER